MGDIRERLDRILEAQRWNGPDGCDLGIPAYICVGFWLSKTDLEDIQPELRRDEGHPDLGEVGRYQSVPVFPVTARLAEQLATACYQGIWFGYIPCLRVD
jgi:hypothetical protein